MSLYGSNCGFGFMSVGGDGSGVVSVVAVVWKVDVVASDPAF